MRTRGPAKQPVVQVLDITQDGETIETRSEPRSLPRWSAVVVIAALVAGMGYGFVLGRGDRPEADREPSASTTSTTSPPTTTITSTGLELPTMYFRRSPPGHRLGEGVSEHLNHNRFSSIAVDDRGMVWAGGPAGVVRLDPLTGEFDPFTGSDGTGPLGVRHIAAGPDGSVHAASARAISHWDGLEWGTDSVLVTPYLDPEQEPREIATIAIDDDGTLWSVTHQWSGSGWTVRSSIHHGDPPFFGRLPAVDFDGYIHELAVGPDGTIWALGHDALWSYDGTWSKASGLDGWWGSALAVNPDGSVWVSREHEIVRIEAADSTPTAVVWWSDALGLGRDNGWGLPGFVRLMTAAPDGSLWLLAEVWEPEPGFTFVSGDSRNVLLRIVDRTVSVVTTPSTFLAISITDMTVAPNGDLWIAHHDGLLRFDGTTWGEFAVGGRPPIGSVHSMTVGPSGGVWLAGEEGVTKLAASGWTQLPRSELLSDRVDDSHLPGDVWATAGSEQVWVGIGCRAARYRGSGWEPLPPLPEEPAECWHVVVAEGPGESLWVAAMRPWGGASDVYRWNGTEWAIVGWVDLEVSDMEIAQDGTIWVAGWDGLGKLEEGEWLPIVSGYGFQQVVVAQDGTLWASTSNGSSSGLWRLHDGRWEIEEEREPVETSIEALASHPDGSVWTLERTSDGRYVARGSQGEYRFIVDTGELHAMTIGPDGTIWVGGEGVLYRIDPSGTSEPDEDLSIVDWRIELDEAGPGVHTVHMRLASTGLFPDQVADTSGTLVWDDATVELCGIGIDNLGDGILEVGDIFQTTEGCGTNPTAMQDAFDRFGLPVTGCVVIDIQGREQPISHCAPLALSPGATP